MTSGSNKICLSDITFRNNFQYGDLGKVLFLHGLLYHQEYGFNHEFETYVAEGLGEFSRLYKKGKSSLWIAEINDNIIGSIAILERANQEAQLRWFLINPYYRGIGLGKILFSKTLNFCRDAGYKTIFLWTLDNLIAARAIYERNGFEMKEQKKHNLWGNDLVEEYYVLEIK